MCSSDNFNLYDFDSCPKLAGAEILTEEETKEACISEDVYYYRSEFYFQCTCCLCFKLVFPVSCDGGQIEDQTREGFYAFIEEAEYLFNIAVE